MGFKPMLSSAIARLIRVNGEQDITHMRDKSMNRSFLCLFLRGMLTTVAMSAILFGPFSAASVQAQAIPQNLLDGNWKNIDPRTRGIDVILINGMKIHPFGVCHPKDCDWGVLKLKARKVASSGNPTYISKMVAKRPVVAYSTDSFTGLTYADGTELVPFETVKMTILLLPDGRLRVDTFTRYTYRNRADQRAVYYFRRFQSPFAP
jgi:hypothetical protein